MMKAPMSSGPTLAYAMAICASALAIFFHFRNITLQSMLEQNSATIDRLVRMQGPFPAPPGWKLQAVYMGNKTFEQLNERWTSQVGQDKTIVDVFDGKPNGYFVELAANDAVKYSNTLTLEQEYNWNGLCVEPNPRYHEGLLHRRCQLVVAVAGRENNDDVEFNMSPANSPICGAACGGVVGAQFDNKPGQKDQLMQFKTVTVEKMFADMGVPREIDYLSLDIEGAELWAFEHFPWDKYIFKVITVERPKGLADVLRKNDYVYVKDHGDFGDQMWIHKSLSNFDAVMAKHAGTK